jgi:hypothetical protein
MQIAGLALIIVAAEEDGKCIGRIRLRTIPDASSASLQGGASDGNSYCPRPRLLLVAWNDCLICEHYPAIRIRAFSALFWMIA